MSDMIVAEPTSSVAKRPLGAQRVMPKPGALEEAYRYYAKGGILLAEERAKGSRRRGKDYKTKEQLMEVIGQGASAWGHINKARNALDVESALLLAKTLEMPVEHLFEIHEAAERHLRGKQREQFRKDREEWNKRWTTNMKAFPLPLEKASSLQVVDWVKKADKIVLANNDDEFEHLDLSTAQLADDFRTRIEFLRKVGRLAAGKQIEDYLTKELSQSAKWGILAARYVERVCVSDPDDAEDLDVRALKVLVLKLSTKSEDPDYVIDRTEEYDDASNAEAACDHEDYSAFEELAAWVAPYDFCEEIRR